MKYIVPAFCLLNLVALSSCSSSDEPEYEIFMQPSAISTADPDGCDQTFEYDDYGRIIAWTADCSTSYYTSTYTARYSYPDNNTIHVMAEDMIDGYKRCYDETIELVKGRATTSVGTFVSYVNDNVELRKTYRLEYDYDPANHLTIVKHAEVVGIDDDIKQGAWDNPWTWENYLIWEDGNLTEFQNYQGHSFVSETTKYEYSIYAVEYPVIMPMVVNNAHHNPLFMQGVFGRNSVNLVKTASIFDSDENLVLSRQYTYAFEQGRITEYTETTSDNTGSSNPIVFTVSWTEK